MPIAAVVRIVYKYYAVAILIAQVCEHRFTLGAVVYSDDFQLFLRNVAEVPD
jgi:hypothetical protein